MAHLLTSSASEFIQTLGLESHFEGGYFKETEALRDGDDLKATQIYYLLTTESSRGGMHMNTVNAFHVHHSGRSLYTLIRPSSSPDSLPEIKRTVMGSNIAAGEVLQLYVPGGWWKASELLSEDLQGAKDGSLDKGKVGSLISEIVVPGWTIEQHAFLTPEKLKDMWHGQDGWQEYEKYLSTQ